MNKRSPKSEVEPLVYTRQEVAALLGIGCTKLQELTTAGVIPHIRIGRTIRFPRAKLIAWLEKLPKLD